MAWDDDEVRSRGENRDLHDVIRLARNGMKKSDQKNHWGIILVIGLIVMGAFTSAYTIPAGNRGVVLRFGEYRATVMPGLHFKVPFGVDRVYKVHTDKVDSETFGFRSVSPGIRSRIERDPRLKRESLMLTGDLNVIDVEWTIQFRRRDPRKYLFNIEDPIQTIRDMSESVIRRIVGDLSFDYMLQNREEVTGIFRDELQQILDEYDSGIYIVGIRLQNVVPPEAVQGAFNEVNEAQQEKERLINEAQETYNREIPKARGEADRLINKSQGYALERVNRAKGETARFASLLTEYKRLPKVTRERLYLETMAEIIPQAGQVYVVDDEQQTLLPLLDMQHKDRREGGK